MGENIMGQITAKYDPKKPGDNYTVYIQGSEGTDYRVYLPKCDYGKDDVVEIKSATQKTSGKGSVYYQANNIYNVKVIYVISTIQSHRTDRFSVCVDRTHSVVFDQFMFDTRSLTSLSVLDSAVMCAVNLCRDSCVVKMTCHYSTRDVRTHQTPACFTTQARHYATRHYLQLID